MLRVRLKEYSTLTEAAKDIGVERSLLSKYADKELTPGTIHFAVLCKWMDTKMEHFFTSK